MSRGKMAARMTVALCGKALGRMGSKVLHHPLRTQVRSVVYTETGGLLDKPEQVRFGLVKVLAVAIPFIYLGGTISMKGAAFLEENDIFVPQEDDD